MWGLRSPSALVLAALVLTGCVPVSASSSPVQPVEHIVAAEPEAVVEPTAPQPSVAAMEAPLGDQHDRYMTLLDSLPVDVERPAMPEYKRTEHFGKAWPDAEGTGCDERNRVLARDLLEPSFHADGCRVLTGVLIDPYTGATIRFQRGQDTSPLVQIDHIVALKDAWESGAWRWDQASRITFANDLDNLLAVSREANAAKGAKSAAQWLPRRDFECEYVRRQVAVKAKYGLSVLVDEKQVLAAILLECRDEEIPS